MAVPTWDEMIRPMLEAACERDITRSDAYSLMCDVFDLSKSQREERLPSGGLRVANRAGWAITHLSKGGLIAKVKRGTYRITDRGREFLNAHPGPISYHALRDDVPEFQLAWQEAMEQKAEKRAGGLPEPDGIEAEATTTPEEAIDRAVNSINVSLRSELMSRLKEIDLYRFEQLVLDVLFLIDGKRLADLMIEYQIGVSAIRTITLKRIDSDYFEGE